MNPLLGISEGFREIWSHKFRSLLTGMGIVLGVASLMSMFAITNGQASQFRRAMQQWGGAEKVTLINRPVSPEQESIRYQSPGRTYADVIALKRSSFVAMVSAEQRLTRGGVMQNGSNEFRSNWIRGVEMAFLEIENHTLSAGRFFTDLDQDHRNRALVIGQRVKRELFGDIPDRDVIGRQILLNGLNFTIVGTFSNYNNRHKDSVTVMPFHTMQELFFSSNIVNGIDLGPINQIDRITVKIKDITNFEESLEQMRNILLRTHNGVEDFGFSTAENWFESVEASVQGVRLSGFIVSGVTLIAAGVGITNIMMTSIRERTREIGVRRALGANGRDIFLQISMESLVLAVLGGLVGIVAGYAMLQFLNDLLSEFAPPELNASSVAISFFAATLIGFLAGIAPALQAARMKPIEALRFE